MPTSESSDVAARPLSDGLDAISRKLVAARLDARPLAEFPGDIPTTLADAYAVQDASIRRWPDAIAGWKVGMVPGEFRQSLAAERLVGPIYRSSVLAVDADDKKTMPIYAGGFAAVEAEFVFRLSTTIAPIEKPRTDAALMDLVAALHVGAEIASSPMADINRLGPCCVVSDFGNNAGLLVGPVVPDWHLRDPDSLTAAVRVDGDAVGTATASAIQGGLLQALRFLIDLSARRGLTLGEGTYISCGALTGIHDVTTASQSTVDFGEFGSFDVAFEPVTPAHHRAALVSG